MFMINFNGSIIDQTLLDATSNRGFKYGDSLFETMLFKDGTIQYLEDHYFRLMASMRMMRMEIPMEFTMDFLNQQVTSTVAASAIQTDQIRVRFTVFRKDGGLYLPKTNQIDFIIEVNSLEDELPKEIYEVELYKDFYVYSGLLSTIKSNNRMLNVVASVYADENGYDNCLLLNENKHLVEAINGNVFIVRGNTIVTPALTEGCIKGIYRKKVIEFLTKHENFQIEETKINPFELQKADEVFITNAIRGIQSVTKYRKKQYDTKVATQISNALERLLSLS